jgi:hypothetical protein
LKFYKLMVVILTSGSETWLLTKASHKTVESVEINFSGTEEGNSRLNNISNHDASVFRMYKLI